MPRKGHIAKRTVAADAVYGSDLVTKFINSMMWQGSAALPRASFMKPWNGCRKGRRRSFEAVQEGRRNAKPLLEVKSRRVGGANYQVPVEVNADRRTSLAIRWLISYARARGEKGMVDKLSNELLDAATGKGAAIKKKEDVHRMAEANKGVSRITGGKKRLLALGLWPLGLTRSQSG